MEGAQTNENEDLGYFLNDKVTVLPNLPLTEVAETTATLCQDYNIKISRDLVTNEDLAILKFESFDQIGVEINEVKKLKAIGKGRIVKRPIVGSNENRRLNCTPNIRKLLKDSGICETIKPPNTDFSVLRYVGSTDPVFVLASNPSFENSSRGIHWERALEEFEVEECCELTANSEYGVTFYSPPGTKQGARSTNAEQKLSKFLSLAFSSNNYTKISTAFDNYKCESIKESLPFMNEVDRGVFYRHLKHWFKK